MQSPLSPAVEQFEQIMTAEPTNVQREAFSLIGTAIPLTLT